MMRAGEAGDALGILICLPGVAACTAVSGDPEDQDSTELIPHVITLPMKLGEMADYGATPWYTDAISMGKSPMRLALDSGASFLWATSDRCRTPACNAHAKIDTGQPGFTWLDTNPASRSLGPWGTMTTWTGEVPVVIGGGPYAPSPFFASVDYSGRIVADLSRCHSIAEYSRFPGYVILAALAEAC